MACKDKNECIKLSKALAKLLRHDAKGLHLTDEVYANVDDILELPFFRNFCVEDIERIVDKDKKGRFVTRTYGGKLQVKASQGHSIEVSDSELQPINHFSEARVVLHGTTRHNFESIRKTGIKRMTRAYIHFAPAEKDAKSGMPVQCNMAIEINIEKALRDGIKFYKAENGVILSRGDSNNCIPKEYFSRAYELKSRKPIEF